MTTQSHHDKVGQQFGSQASAYLTSAVHASGRDLERLSTRLADFPHARLLDMGCGAGHASFIAAAQVKEVVAYDLSDQMLVVVKEATKSRGLNNVVTQQGMRKSCLSMIARLMLSLAVIQPTTGMMSVKRCVK